MGSDLVSFHLQSRNSVNSTWVDLVGSEVSSNLITVWRFNVVKATNYELRYRVKNVYGWS